MSVLFGSARKRVVWLALGCWIIVLGLLQVITVPYVRLAPGPTFNVLGQTDGTEVITISGAQQYPTDGELDMTTVAERGGPYGRLTLVEAFTGWIKPDVKVVPTSLLYPPDTSGQTAQDEGAEQFVDSQEKARIAALEQVGEPVSTYPWIVSVRPDSPASTVLQHGDVVLSIDGKAVSGPHEVARYVQAAGPDTNVRLRVRRGHEELTYTLRTQGNPDDPSKGYLGVTVGVMADSPVKVGFHLDDVGGPSAGLIFALGIVDKLTPGELLDGRTVAGTGTMDYDGSVGPIGGIGQKMAAARSSGADLFLAPADNCPEVLASPPQGLQVAAVRTLDQAVKVLEGQEAVTSCSVVAGQ